MRLVALLVSLLSALNAGAGSSPSPSASSQDPKLILTSFPILEDVVKQLAPEGLRVECLVPRNGDIHSYKPTAQDLIRLEKAPLILLWGLGLDDNIRRLTLSKSFQSRTHIVTDTNSKLDTTPSSSHESVTHSEDPHLWQSPSQMIPVVLRIEDILKANFPSETKQIERNSKQFRQSLEKIGREYQSKFKKLPKSQKKLVTPHQAFDHLASEMGLESASLLGADPEQSPSLKSLQGLIQRLKREKTQVLFREPGPVSPWLQNVARETGAQIRGPLFADQLTLEPPTNSYPQVLEYNLETIWTALQEVPK